MNNVYLHIGLGRTSSTTLQTQIFPEIAKFRKNCTFFSIKSSIIRKNLKSVNDRRILYKSLIDNLKTGEELILSDETLLGEIETKTSNSDKYNVNNRDIPWPPNSHPWCPSTYYESYLRNCKIFDKNTNIIITIRKPSIWLRSVFSKCSSENPSKFFVSKKDEKTDNTFLITEFDLNKLINLYKKNFKNVFVIKFENISNFNFARKIFDLNENEIENIKKKYKKKIIKKGYNLHGFKFKLFLTKIGKSRIGQIIPSIKTLSNGGKLEERLVLAYEKIFPHKEIYLNFSNLGYDIKKKDQEYESIDSI